MVDDVREKLIQRLGRVHAKQRLGIEIAHEAQVFGRGLTLINIENLYSFHWIITLAFQMTGLYSRGRKNAARVQVRHNHLRFEKLPPAFDGFTILHLSDLHVDISAAAIERLTHLLPDLDYDICVLTGDYRGRTFGRHDAAIDGLAQIKSLLKPPIYGVLGNHDTIRMVPDLEAMGVRMLLNECETIARGDQRIHLAGIDDAHYFRVDNIEKATAAIPEGEFAILLSHTPEVYKQAAHAGFDLLLGGHTHGGQICLPGSIPITLDSAMPRRFGSGAWTYHGMQGYTSVGVGTSIVPIRFNCPPEITLHRLSRA